MPYPDLCPETKLPFVIMDDDCCSSCGKAHGISALKIINLSNNLFENTSDNPPYRCKSHKINPELFNLEHNLFRESFYQMESESGIKITAYARDIGTFDEDSYLEILTEDEWIALPIRPPRIDELKKEIKQEEDAEFLAGIRHYKNFSGWFLPDVMKTIKTPKLEYTSPCVFPNEND